MFLVTFVLSCSSVNKTIEQTKSEPVRFQYIFECADKGQKVERTVTSTQPLNLLELKRLNNTIVEKYGYDYKSCQPTI
jgi:hypothetical protein